MESDFNAYLNGRGIYQSFQFVLRLSPLVHAKLSEMPGGLYCRDDISDPELIKAYAVYLHETVHWWQHVGSTAGFLMSLSYPAQAHANYGHLRRLMNRIGPIKSIQRYCESSISTANTVDSDAGMANTILNTFYDLEFFRILITSPELVHSTVNSPLFESEGHCYNIGYANTLSLISTLYDNDFSVIPDPRGWDDEFSKLKLTKLEGYFHGSDVKIAPVARGEIFEGQARFAQLQYLYFALNEKYSWSDIENEGLLGEKYTKAFNLFLELSGLQRPESIHDPVVGLFMLICDISINPGEGLPLPLWSFSTFISDVHPGMRFCQLCTIVGRRPERFSSVIREYSREEYIEVSEALTKELLLFTPLQVAEAVAMWKDGNNGFRTLMNQYKTFEYVSKNLPVSLLLSHFIEFNSDKLMRPEFFCWPGAHMVGSHVNQSALDLFEKHAALFVDKEDDDAVFPRILKDRDQSIVHRAFTTFYEFNVVYDMTRQWISKPGHFVYEYDWLFSPPVTDRGKAFADRNMESAFGIHPDNFKIL